MMGNIQGLYPKTNQNKVPFLREIAEEEDPMFIALTETHLKSDVKEAEISITKYTPFRVDRETRSHGGVIVYIRNDLATDTKQILSVSNGQVEVIALQISPMGMIIVNCYRPPQCSTVNFTTALNMVKEAIDDLPSPMPDIVMCGDYNFPHIK